MGNIHFINNNVGGGGIRQLVHDRWNAPGCECGWDPRP